MPWLKRQTEAFGLAGKKAFFEFHLGGARRCRWRRKPARAWVTLMWAGFCLTMNRLCGWIRAWQAASHEQLGWPHGWFMSYDKTSDGRMLFGGSKGILVVRPEGFDVSDFSPRLVVSDVYVNGARQKAGQILQGLQVTPEQRSFGVEFAALDFSDLNRIRYAYRLAGFDPDWINRDAGSRLVSYSNLDPGHYVLQVRAPTEVASVVRMNSASRCRSCPHGGSNGGFGVLPLRWGWAC
jgi:hypothetical protein